MSIKAVEGEMLIPPVAAVLEAEDLRKLFSLPPEAEVDLSSEFYPDPQNKPGETALFNIFLHSVDYTGDVFLVKRPPPNCLPGVDHWCQPISRVGSSMKPLIWNLKPGDAIADTVEEPENGVRYALAMINTLPGMVHFRLSN